MLTLAVSSLAIRLLFTSISAFVIMIILGKPMIKYLQLAQIGQVIRTVGPESHFSKKGTPTMGGILIVVAITLSSLCFGDWHSALLLTGLATLWAYGAIGFWDDYKKLILKHHQGLAAKYKYFWQSVFAVLLAVWFYHYLQPLSFSTDIFLPFRGYVSIGLLLLPLTYFTLVGSSNAVNLTDGLDGLASMSIMIVALGLGILALLKTTLFPQHLLLNLPDVSQIAILAAAIIGASLGFLWFNSYPAQVFMGDVGSLGLGALLAYMAIALQMELILVIMGGIFVLETVSVMLQVSSFKLRNKKRIFKMAPIHHHFELMGCPEPRVVMRFSIASIILMLLGILSLLI